MRSIEILRYNQENDHLGSKKVAGKPNVVGEARGETMHQPKTYNKEEAQWWCTFNVVQGKIIYKEMFQIPKNNYTMKKQQQYKI